MGARADMMLLADRLRHAPTRLLPLELCERIQHLIVRIEGLVDGASDELAAELTRAANELLAAVPARPTR